jgi:Fe-S-cluster-containing hydrogenase component 2
MTDRMLVVDFAACTGCRNCEMACSVFHVRACNPSKSAVRVVKLERERLDVPVVCQQCEDPTCASICPVEAISRDLTTGAVIVDPDLCVGCRMCIVACPFGALTFDSDLRQPIKCDLCGGAEPWCVRFCEPGALTCGSPAAASLTRKRAVGRHIVDGITPPTGGAPSAASRKRA